MKISKIMFLVVLLPSFFGGSPGLRAEDEITLSVSNDLIKNFVQIYKGPKEMAVGVWYAEPIWEMLTNGSAPAAEGGASANEQDVILLQKFMRPYTLMALLCMKVDASNEPHPYPEDWLRKKARLVDMQGKKHKALSSKEIPAEMIQFLKMARYSALVQGNPEMAENVHFLVFPNTDRSGQSLIDYRRSGSFSVQVGRSTLIWHTPVEAPSRRLPL